MGINKVICDADAVNSAIEKIADAIIKDFCSNDKIEEFALVGLFKQGVPLSFATSFVFILISQSWLLYTPAPNDWAAESIHVIFENTPRLLLASFLVYAICQRFDVWMYHKLWEVTTDKAGNSDRFLWIRNNGATLISQLLNTVLYTFGAFGGLYDLNTLINICISSYVIFIVTSLADTPFIYLARYLDKKHIRS